MVTLASTFLVLLLFEAQLQSVVAQADAPAKAVHHDDEPTCSLDASSKSDCSDAAVSNEIPPTTNSVNLQDLTRQVISLTDDNFDDLTWTSSPATWLIMFKTDACGLCKKTRPVLDNLCMDLEIGNHNERELVALIQNKENGQIKKDEALEIEDLTPKGPVYVYEETAEGEGGTPKGPVYIATIDAGYSGRDTTKRFDVEATPTIILLRNEGYNDEYSKSSSRSFYTYRGQRATYPLRTFVLGGYAARKEMEMPPPLAVDERKPQTYWGRVFDSLSSPSAKWAGGIIGKLLLVWFVFIGGLGLFMRVHNYAWGDASDDDDTRHEKKERELEKEKAQGRREFGKSKECEETQEERSTRRQKVMWEQKATNRAKFAANQETRIKKKDRGNGDGDDEMSGVGFSVKKSDVQKISKDAEKKAA